MKEYTLLNRAYLSNQGYLKDPCYFKKYKKRGYLSNPLWTQLHFGPRTSTCLKHCQVLLFPSCYTRLLKRPNLLLNSTTFRAKDLYLFQTLSSIVISFLWYLSVFQVVKVANLGSCDETKVKVANPGSESESWTKWMWQNELPREYIGYK